MKPRMFYTNNGNNCRSNVKYILKYSFSQVIVVTLVRHTQDSQQQVRQRLLKCLQQFHIVLFILGNACPAKETTPCPTQAPTQAPTAAPSTAKPPTTQPTTEMPTTTAAPAVVTNVRLPLDLEPLRYKVELQVDL